MDESVNVGSKKQAHQKPPLSLPRIAGEILAGAGVGFLAGLAGAVVRCIMFPIASTGCFGGNFIVILFFTFLWAYGPASAVGVYLVGKRDDGTGSFLWTLGCGFAGVPVIMGITGMPDIIQSLFGFHVPARLPCCASVPLLLLIPPVMATCAFNLTRGLASPVSKWFTRIALPVLFLICFILLRGSLEDPRRRALWQMNRMESGHATLEELIEGLKSSDWQFRESAAGGLAKLGPKAKPAVPALTEALKYRDTGSSAAYALAAVGPDAEPAIPALVEAIRRAPRILAESNHNYDSFQKNAAQALARIGPASLPALNELIKDEQVYARRCAAEALGMMGPEAKPAAPALADALQDEDEVVRQRARAALERIDPNWSQTVEPE